MKNKAKYLIIFFTYFILIIYSLELLLFIFAPKTQKDLVKVDEIRLSRAKELGLNYDLRSRSEAFLEEEKKNANLAPVFYFNNKFSRFKYFNKAITNNNLMPFRGPINKQTLSCTEDFQYRIINNDQIGFKNPNSIYEKKIDIAILGDSYAEGLCYKEKNDIAGNLRKLNYNTANFGVTGSGPLVALGVFNEYVKAYKPKIVIYLYFEGNDISDLNWERDNTNLTKYLDNDYSQNLMLRKKEIEIFLNELSKESYNYLRQIADINKNYGSEKNKKILEQIIDILELTRLKYAIKNISYLVYDKEFDKDLFFSIFDQMNESVKNWDGKFIFVYVPSWSRYFEKFTKIGKYFIKKDMILREIKRKNILIVDLTKFFGKENDVKKYFPLELPGHFNKNGYKKISEILYDKIRDEKIIIN